MAEAIVSIVGKRLGDLLIQESSFLYGVSDQVQRLQTDLRWMQSFLKDADARQDGDERIRLWVSEIRNAAYDAEDVIDTFILKVASRRRGGLQGFLKRLTCIFNESLNIHQVGTQIEAIQARIRDLTTRLQTFGLKSISEGEGTSSTNERLRHRRRSYPHFEEEHVVGLDEEIAKLVQQLIEKENQLWIVSIVGMGGLGKTTLAKRVYNHNVVKQHFDCSAWAFISQEWRVQDVLRGILIQMGAATKEERDIIEKMRDEELVEKVYKFLEGKLYLVVLDDIWSREAWDNMRPAFPKGKKGSKIIMTTRNREVPLHANPQSFLHELRYLTEDEGWELLSQKALMSGDSTSSGTAPGLEMLGKEMVRHCGGLPLAIVVLGGLLATKNSLDDWKMVSKNITLQLRKGKGQQQHGKVEDVLALSYRDLPYHLKPSFLYLGLFPEDYEIPAKKLIRMWVAEGFIASQQVDGEETMEDVAREWLEELIQRCMVQVGRRDSTGRVKSCRMHDLLRDLSVLKAREDHFLEIFSPNSFHSNAGVETKAFPSRRIAVHSHYGYDLRRYFSLKHKNSHLRSVLFFEELQGLKLEFMCKNFLLIRVLNLERIGIKIDRLPNQIGSLVHLKYLGIRLSWPSKIEVVLPSISNLVSLQTLDLEDSSGGPRVPNVLWKMEQLRHLRLPWFATSEHLRVDTLKNLQTLLRIEAGDWMLKDLAQLTNLQTLHVVRISRVEQVEALLQSPSIRFDRLRYLRLDCLLYCEFPSLEPLSHCHNLFKLFLNGKMKEMVLEQPQLPSNLTKLTLWNTRLEEHDPMATLEKLPNLKILSLHTESYVGTKMTCSANGFPLLESLGLQGLQELEEWRVEARAMPRLKNLEIDYCENLRMVPEGLRFITTLKELKISGMPETFNDRLRVGEGGEGGEDFYKVQHIPSIQFEW